MMRGPPGPPRQDQALPNTNENKPTIRPLMSLSPPPLPLGQQGFDFDLDDEPWKGTPDRRGRKRSAEQEGFRDGERPDRGPDRGPPKPMRPEDEWRRGPGRRAVFCQSLFLHSLSLLFWFCVFCSVIC